MPINREKVLEAAQKFVEKKKYDRAVAEYQKIIQEDPNDARILLKIGDLQSKMAEFGNAIATYEKVGKFYAQQGFALKAIAVYKQIREIIAKHVPGLEDRYSHITPLLADLYQQLGLTSDALAALDEVATRYQRQQRDQEAIEVFQKIVAMDQTNPLPHLRLAEALSRIKDVDTAVREFGLAAALLVKLGRKDDAIKVFERLLHHKPDPVHARLCAEQYLERGQAADGMQALAKLQIAFQSNPKDLDTLALLARAFGAIGQAAKGIEVQKEMARLARDQGNREVFQQTVDKLLRVAPNDEAVRALAASGAGAAVVPPPPPVIRDAPRGANVDELSYEHVVDSGEIEDAQPEDDAQSFALVSDRPAPPSAPRYDVAPPRAKAPSRQDGTSQALPGRGQHQDEYDAAPDLAVDDGEDVSITSQGNAPEPPNEEIQQVLSDAASFRRVRLYAKAIETLRGGLEIDPASREVRETLRDVLLDARSYPEAVAEMLVLASMLVDAGDVDGAARGLYDVLAVDRENRRAMEILAGLGYALPEGIVGPQDDAAEYTTDEAPLASYELDETGAQRARTGEPSVHGMDEPFGAGEAPLPSFPMDAPESEATFDLVQGKSGFPGPPGAPAGASGGAPGAASADESAGFAVQPQNPPQHTDLEDALEEVDFYASRGLYDDARAILNEQLTVHPNHILLRERIAELDTQEQGARGGSGTRAVPQSAQVDRSFDIAASLDAIENLDTASGLPAGFKEQDEQVDVEEVFAAFKEGVAKQVPQDDSQSHYDLGVAYKEMGLTDDAVREFEVAARDPKRECVCRSTIGMIELERGRVNDAIDAFMKGLNAKMRTPEQETVLSFEIGAAYESMKRSKDALTYYQKVARRDPSYRDVQERIRKLNNAPSKAAPRAAAVGADDEFDRAFDEIIGGSKLP